MRRKIWNITTARSTNITINNINTFKFYNSNDLAFRGGGSGGGQTIKCPPPLFVLQNVKISGIFLNWLYLLKIFACG